jgi:hypothetical protein
MTMLGLRSHCRGLGLGPRRSRSHASASTFHAVVAPGIASELTFGAPTVTVLAELVMADGIASGLTFGAPTITIPTELVVADGIASGLTISAPAVTVLAELVVANGIPSGLTFGGPAVTVPAELVMADGIASGLTVGAPTITIPAELVMADGIASGLTVGVPAVTALAELVVANGIASGLTFGAPAVTGLAELVVANGIASGLTFGGPTVTVPAELVVANGIASGLTFGSPTLATAPSIRTQIIQGRSGADPHNVTTSGFGWVAGDLVLAFTGISGTVTLSSVAGLTDDTYTQLTAVLPGAHDHRQYLHRGTVNGGAFDSTTRWDLSGSRPIVLALLSIVGGHSTLDASATDFGTGGALPSAPAITTTGPNRLIIAVATIRGAHVTNPPSAPSGYTLLGNAFTSSNNSNGTGQSTISVAYKAAPDAGTVAAASWGGLSNINSQPWETVQIAVKPA